MKIKDPDILEMFGKTGKKGYTPAELSKTYNLNKYREILANNTSSPRAIETAEAMIQNYNLKLGALALVQESMKGFENGDIDQAYSNDDNKVETRSSRVSSIHSNSGNLLDKSYAFKPIPNRYKHEQW